MRRSVMNWNIDRQHVAVLVFGWAIALVTTLS
jgi:hypothetical protein